MNVYTYTVHLHENPSRTKVWKWCNSTILYFYFETILLLTANNIDTLKTPTTLSLPITMFLKGCNDMLLLHCCTLVSKLNLMKVDKYGHYARMQQESTLAVRLAWQKKHKPFLKYKKDATMHWSRNRNCRKKSDVIAYRLTKMQFTRSTISFWMLQ